MHRIILFLVALFLIRKLILLIGTRGYRVNSQNNNQDDVYQTVLQKEQERSVYNLDAQDKQVIDQSILNEVQENLDTIISYLPTFRIARFVNSVYKSLTLIVDLLQDLQLDSTNKSVRDKLEFLIDTSYIKSVQEKKALLANQVQSGNCLQIKQIYMLSTKTFIMLQDLKSGVEWTFARDLKTTDLWYLTQIHER